MTKKTLIITGASGFLGSWLADAAYEADYELLGVDLRSPLKPGIWSDFVTASTDNVDWNGFLNGKNIYGVCHLAGGASVKLSEIDPYSDFSNLMPGTARLALYLSNHHPGARFFLFSSAAVYGNLQPSIINESADVKPISAYGIHKLIAEKLLQNYARIYKLNVTILRIFSVYGPGLRKQLIWDVCNKALSANVNGVREITLFGTGNETRDFIYVKDLCAAVIALLKQPAIQSFEVFNIASGESRTIDEVARGLIKHLNIEVKINFSGNLPKGDPINLKADVSQLKRKGIVSHVTIDQGLLEVALWIRNLFEDNRPGSL